ncbi:hypothetical protein WJT86_12210 [Microvirga sp. W0021]|uniref:Uncharacterized protein n=1 Tax=Hohaiivirga grylli TaxID=3133970 RepID=A0ABV0BMB2_9HYPH
MDELQEGEFMRLRQVEVYAYNAENDSVYEKFCLSKELSAWLSLILFWSKLNHDCGTLFSEFDSEFIHSKDTINKIIFFINNEIENLKSQKEFNFKINSGIDNKENNVSREKILLDLNIFKKFLMTNIVYDTFMFEL